MAPLSVSDIPWRDKTALVRADLNTPLAVRNGTVQVADNSRIRAVLPTLRHVAENGGHAVILSHLGRPGGKLDSQFSLSPVAAALEHEIGQPVAFHSHSHHSHPESQFNFPPVFHLMENTRFHSGESQNDSALAQQFAALGDVFVMDAFACAHRAEASTCAIAQFAQQKCVGLLLQNELNALNRVLQNAPRPVVGVFGGAKIADKIPVIQNLSPQLDSILVGGAAANTLLLAQGIQTGKSLAQPSIIPQAQKILAHPHALPPHDAVVADNPDSTSRVAPVSNISESEMILDIGPDSARAFADIIRAARTIIWNGPMGLFEKDAFAKGTQAVCNAVCESSGFSLAGGGETLAAIARFGDAEKISHISTGGGALLEYLSGRKLPGLVAVGAQ